jgi:hypothetical protein
MLVHERLKREILSIERKRTLTSVEVNDLPNKSSIVTPVTWKLRGSFDHTLSIDFINSSLWQLQITEMSLQETESTSNDLTIEMYNGWLCETCTSLYVLMESCSDRSHYYFRMQSSTLGNFGISASDEIVHREADVLSSVSTSASPLAVSSPSQQQNNYCTFENIFY